MSIVKEIIEIAGNTADLFTGICAAAIITHCFYDESLKVTRNKIIAILLIILPGAVTSVLAPESFVVNNPFIIISLLFAPVVIMVISSGKRFWGTVGLFLRLLITEMFVGLAAEACFDRLLSIFGINITGDVTEKFWYYICISIVPVLIIIFLYFCCIRRGRVMYFRTTEKLLVAVYCMALLTTAIETENEKPDRMMDLLTLLLIMITPVLIYKNRLSVFFSEQSADNERFLEAELAASRQYRETEEETRAFRHDIKNELSLLSALMREKRFDEAESSLNDMLGRVSDLSPRIVTGDDMLDSLISSKLHDLEQNGIEITVKGVLEGGLDWRPIDICSVFANAIDNAAEACMKLKEEDERYIHITFRKTEMQRVITIRNPAAENVDVKALNAGRYRTSKSDTARHGFGVRNIRRTVEKYGGMLSYACENREVTLTIVLMK
jgi:uncharacterized membrane protein